jgi:hypothetical protein
MAKMKRGDPDSGIGITPVPVFDTVNLTFSEI